MRVKTASDAQIKQLLLLRSQGASIPQIHEVTDLSVGAISKYIRQYQSEIKKMMNEHDISEIGMSHGKGKERSQEGSKKKKPRRFASIESETTKSTIRKGADLVSSIKAREITEDYKAAQMLHSASIRYRKNIEMMGLDWDRFMAWAIDEGYQRAVEVYKRKLQKHLMVESIFEEAIQEDLENPKRESMNERKE